MSEHEWLDLRLFLVVFFGRGEWELTNYKPGGIMGLQQLRAATTVRASVGSLNERTSLTAHAVLQEMFELLEDYAPIWYTEDLHNRAMAILATSH